MREIEKQKLMHAEELRKQREAHEKELKRQHSEFLEWAIQRKKHEKEELKNREKERLEAELKQTENIAEIQRLKMQREEARRKAEEELEAAKKTREYKAAMEKREMEEAKRVVRKEKERLIKEKAKSKEEYAYAEQTSDPETRIHVINTVPIMMVMPDEAAMQSNSSFPKDLTPEDTTKKSPQEMWEDILRKNGKRPKP